MQIEKTSFLRYTRHMEHEHRNHFRAQNFFTLTGLAILVFIWFALALGVSGLFMLPLIAFGFSLMSTLILFLCIKTLSLLPAPEKAFLLVLTALAMISALSAEPTVFTGRDQGAIATAAIALAEHHAFHFSTPVATTFFSLYGPGLAYNFPGFFYTEHGELLTQFPLAYTAWLGSFYQLFHLNGFQIGNAVLLAFSSCTFYFLLRIFLRRLLAFLGALLLSTAFLPVWFVKFTLTENLALFLFLFLTLSLIRFRQEGKFLHYAATLSAAGILFFTRIEGTLILPLTCALLAFHPQTRNLWKQYPLKSLVAPTLLFLLTLAASLSDMLPFFITIGKALRDFLLSFTLHSNTLTSTSTSLSFSSLLFSYGLLLVWILGIFGFCFLLWKKRFSTLLPAIIALPTFAYLFFPNITPDHPWMLRRYLPTIYPVFLFFAVVGPSFFFAETKRFPLNIPESPRRRFILILIFISLFSSQAHAWYQGLLARENPVLLEETRQAATFFGPHDLVLIDRNTTGSGFAMLAGPLASLYHKNAAYFFNPADFSRLDRSLYEHTWLVVPQDQAHQWMHSLSGYTLTPRHTLIFTSSSLAPRDTSSHSGFRFPEAKPFSNTAVIFEIQ